MAEKPKKHAGGRPRTKTPVFIPNDVVAQIEQMAKEQCKDCTIAAVVGIDEETFKRQFAALTHKKRCEGKAELYKCQFSRAATDKSDTMLIWLGKQHLEQSDRQDTRLSGEVTILPPKIG